MIPKVIHYCWFGGKPKPEVIQKCIDSWKLYCPDYEIIEWNENNFDVNCITYTQKAYADKKWAFVSDYARLKIIFEHGGFYLDTDVLLENGNINNLLQYPCWLASDDVRHIATGLGFGAEREHWVIKAMMNAYNTYEYPGDINVVLETKTLEQCLPEWKKTDSSQIVSDILLIGINDYGKYAKHLYTNTWKDDIDHEEHMERLLSDEIYTVHQRRMYRFKCWVRNPALINYFDKKRGSVLERLYTFCAYDLLDYGPWHFVKRLFIKIRKKLGF